MRAKLVSAGAGLFGFGALVGWAVTADYYEKRMREQAEGSQERLRLLRERLTVAESFVENISRTPEQEEPQDDEASILAQIPAQEGGNSPEGVTGETDEAGGAPEESEEATRTRLQGLIDGYNADPDSIEHFVELGATSERDTTPPFIIDRETYSWDEEGEHFAKITLMYYPQYRILLDDDQDPIEDVAGTVGWRNLSQFGPMSESGDEDTIFVRNRRLMTDFEVIRDEENALPLHVKYSMGRDEFETAKAAGVLKLRPEDA